MTPSSPQPIYREHDMKQVLLHLLSAVAVAISSVVIIVGLVVISSGVVSQHQHTHLMVSTTNNDSSSRVMKRRRLSENNLELPLWAEQNLVDNNERPNPSAETALFWHIPKSGGTTAKRLYECMGQTLANRLGADPRFGHDKDDEIVVFHPFSTESDVKFVNVDTTTKSGITRAEELGLVQSGKVDMIFTSDINFAADHLFDSQHKGRILAFFRHPIDRLASKFYYLQTATWERTYRPEWQGMNIIEWATNENLDENFIVKKIMGKKLSDTVDMNDLIIAKEIIRRYFVVGMMVDMAESVRRFNIVLGVDYASERGQQCMQQYFAPINGRRRLQEEKAKNDMNSNPHPKILEGSPEYQVLAERNALDMILYNYITLLYEEQRLWIDSLVTPPGY